MNRVFFSVFKGAWPTLSGHSVAQESGYSASLANF